MLSPQDQQDAARILKTKSDRAASVAGLNALQRRMAGLGFGSPAPRSGYMGEPDYIQGLNDDAELADIQARANGGTGATVRASYGGTNMATRPSLSALRGDSGYDDPNLRTIEPTFEQRRQGAVLAGMDARTDRELEHERQMNDEAFDINTGRPMMRAQAQGEAARSQQRQNVNSQAETYFDPSVKRMREDVDLTDLSKLRARYTDPAIIRGQAALEEARTRGMFGNQRETIRGQYTQDTGAARNEAMIRARQIGADAQIGASVAGAGGDPTSYRPAPPAQGPVAPQQSRGKTFNMSDLSNYARDTGVSLQQAYQDHISNGYVFDPNQ